MRKKRAPINPQIKENVRRLQGIVAENYGLNQTELEDIESLIHTDRLVNQEIRWSSLNNWYLCRQNLISPYLHERQPAETIQQLHGKLETLTTTIIPPQVIALLHRKICPDVDEQTRQSERETWEKAHTLMSDTIRNGNLFIGINSATRVNGTSEAQTSYEQSLEQAFLKNAVELEQQARELLLELYPDRVDRLEEVQEV